MSPHIALLCTTFLLNNEGDGLEWNQWRGPSRSGHFEGPTWPESLSSLSPTWRVELGASYAGPIVTADRVFSVETKEQELEVVRALDRETGEELWSTQWQGSMTVPFFAARNGSWVRSTPAFDGERLYVAGMRDVLVCLDAESGSELWRVDFVKDYGTPPPDFGFASSPLVDDEAVYVQAGSSCFKLDKQSGEEIWRTLDDGGGMNGSAFSSPVLSSLHGESQVLVQTRSHLCGVDSELGNVLWTVPVKTFRGMNILTPTVHEDRIFTSAYGGRGHLFRIDSIEGDYQAVEEWSSRAQGYMTSPVVVDGHAYLFLRSNRLACVNLDDGSMCWTSAPTGDEYMSLVHQGDRILALGHSGSLYLLRANPEKYDVIDQREIAESETWAHLAVAGEEIFVRELNAMSAFEWPSKAQLNSPVH